MSSVLIRVSSKTKQKLDALREDRYMKQKSKGGYVCKIHYSDILEDLLTQKWYQSDEHVRYNLIQNITNNINNAPGESSPGNLVSLVCLYLDTWLRLVGDKHSDYEHYKCLLSSLRTGGSYDDSLEGDAND